MTLIIEVPKTEEEFYRIAEIRSLAFGSHPFIEMLFPRHATHEGRVLLRDRLLEIQKMPSARFLIVRDTETSEIISQAEWHFYPPESKGDVMDLGFVEGSEDDKEFARHILGNFQAKRRAAIADTSVPLILLDSLTTDPTHQKRGAGSMLVKWCTDMADLLNGEVYLEASDLGRPVYEKSKFAVLEYFSIPIPPKWAGRLDMEYCLMRRPVIPKLA